jgi:pyrroline-5-carboxylate reductase
LGTLSSLGVVGCGNMGSAIVRGVSNRPGSIEEVHVFDVDEEASQALAKKHDVSVASSLEDLSATVDVIIVAVKPAVVPDVLESLEGSSLRVASIAAGVDLDTMSSHLPAGAEIIRVMPNTPAQVGEGMSFLAPGETASDSFVDTTRSVFESVGRAFVIDEEKMDAVTALSGSGPAYLFYFLEAMTEAGVYLGLDQEQAQVAAEQTVLGAAKLARERSEDGPAKLRAEVSSPGGTTVEAIKHLDEQGVKGVVEEAIKQARDRSRELGS